MSARDVLDGASLVPVHPRCPRGVCEECDRVYAAGERPPVVSWDDPEDDREP